LKSPEFGGDVKEIGMTRTRRSFTDEFKREAVKLCKQPGATITHIARDLGIETSVLRRWVTQERGGVLDLRPNRPLRSEAATEVERLQRELRRVTTERDILKKSARLLRKGPAVKYGFIARHRSVWPTRTMCRVLAV
jgi:transposase